MTSPPPPRFVPYVVRPEVIAAALGATLTLGGVGVAGAWLMRRRTTLAIKNLYLAATAAIAATAVAGATRSWSVLVVLVPLGAPFVAGAVAGRCWLLSDLGAGEELRQHELSRRWFWEPALAPRPGERSTSASQGEIVRERPWPAEVQYVPMTAREDRGAPLPLGEGQQIFVCG